MLKRLRRKFTAITMLLVGLVLAGVLGSSLFSSALTQRGIVVQILQRAISDGIATATVGDSSDTQSAELMLAVVVDVTQDGIIFDRTSFVANVPDETLREVVRQALASKEESGRCEGYEIAWMRTEASWGWRIAFVDTYLRGAALRAQALSSLAIFVVSMGAIFVVSYGLSGWVLRPVRRAWDQQRRFVSDASHELKTPLAVILANTQILERMEGLPPDAQRWVSSTSDEAGHMKVLVDDLLTLARADEQGSERVVARDEVSLSGLVERCALEFDPVAFERGCSIECAVEPGLVTLGDGEQLARLVRTLLDNATKYARQGSEVTAALAREGRRARLSVNNHGDVIPPEDIEHLFDRFYRTDEARERKETGGFGLGLAIARSIAEAHGGTIGVTSSAEAGTTFTVTLPLAGSPSPHPDDPRGTNV